MNFLEANSFLESLINYEKKNIKGEFDFERFLKDLNEFGNPQLHLKNPCIIAGTKGKGSTAHHIVSGFIQKGFKNVGLYTSPHVMDVRERIRIGNDLISEKDFIFYVSKIKEKVEKGIFLTYFEALTIIAFLYFKDKNTDFNVLEIGLGGRLDAVNSCQTDFSIITPISYDHEHILGNTLSKIAYEKSFVIKGKNTIISPQPKEVLEVLIDRAKKVKSEVYLLSLKIPFKIKEASLNGTSFKIYFDNRWHEVFTKLIGDFQAINAACAFLYLYLMGIKNYEFTEFKIFGRFEKILDNPFFIVDGAHNPLSISAVVRNVKNIIKKTPDFLIFGSNKDKNIAKMLKILERLEPKNLVLTQSHIPRRENPKVIYEIAKGLNFSKIATFEDAYEAFNFCLENSNSSSLILLVGSFYLVELAKKFVNFIIK
ncbi:MAG: Mur ligase family protein [Candidatus Hydrothermales bacterium]